MSLLGEYLHPSVSIPAFSLAFLVGLFVKVMLEKLKLTEYVNRERIQRISGSATDLLVAFGIASIRLEVVVQYALPLFLLLTFGLLLAFFLFLAIIEAVFRTVLV